jgi:hypothetical protein
MLAGRPDRMDGGARDDSRAPAAIHQETTAQMA